MEEILRSPVEVGCLSRYLRGFSTIPGGYSWISEPLSPTDGSEMRLWHQVEVGLSHYTTSVLLIFSYAGSAGFRTSTV